MDPCIYLLLDGWPPGWQAIKMWPAHTEEIIEPIHQSAVNRKSLPTVLNLLCTNPTINFENLFINVAYVSAPEFLSGTCTDQPGCERGWATVPFQLIIIPGVEQVCRFDGDRARQAITFLECQVYLIFWFLQYAEIICHHVRFAEFFCSIRLFFGKFVGVLSLHGDRYEYKYHGLRRVVTI